MKIIGVGNDHRGDDAIGLLVARALDGRLPGVQVSLLHGDGAALLEACRSEFHVIVVDCARSGAPPGTIHHFLADQKDLSCRLFADSTHTFGIAEAIELGRVLRELPPVMEVFAIEGEAFAHSGALTDAVRNAGDQLVQRLCRKYGDGAGPPPTC